MADNENSDSGSGCEMDFFSDLLNCDVRQLPAIDSSRLQNEIQRLSESSTTAETGNKSHQCSKCEMTFSLARNLNRHLRSNTCSRSEFICQHCGRIFKRKARHQAHIGLGKCIRPRKSSTTATTTSNSSTTTATTSGSSNCQETSAIDNQCDKCMKKFASKKTLRAHVLRKACASSAVEQIFQCRHCSKNFSSLKALKLHLRTHTNSRVGSAVPNRNGGGGGGGGDDDGGDGGDNSDAAAAADDDDDDHPYPQRRRSFFQGALIKYTLKAHEAEQSDLTYFFANRRAQLRRNICRELTERKAVKWYVVVKIEMGRFNSEGDLVDVAVPTFRSFTKQAITGDVADAQIDEAYFKMLNSLDAFRADGSGWHIRKVLHMVQTLTKFRPLSGSCTLYKLPERLLRKKCLLNVTGPAELNGHCFEYAVLAGLHTEEAAVGQIPWSDLHQYRNTLNFEGIAGSGQFMPVTSIGEFEQKNALSINVYGYEDEEDIFPVYVTQNFNRERHTNLLLLCSQSDTENDAVRNYQTFVDQRQGHYCVIKRMSALISSQLGTHTEEAFVCMRCLTHKRTAEALTEHERICSLEEPMRCVMPGQGEKWMKFRNYGRLMRVGFVIVASFSCYTVPLLETDEPTHGYEVRERRLDPCAYSYVRISLDNSHPKPPVYYRGTDPEDTMEHFLSDMMKEEEEVFSIVSQTAPMTWCDEGFANVEASNDICSVCLDLLEPNDRIVLDHSHISGKIRGRTHNRCNLKMKEATFLPCVFQNLSHFEGRLILKAVGKFGQQAVTVIPQSLDTFVSISINRCRYLDFKRFLKAPLNDLVETLRRKSGLDAFKFVRQFSTAASEEDIDTLVKRQVFCADYIDTSARLSETSLPPAEAFYDRVNDAHISTEDYEHAKRLWTLRNARTIDDYLEHHLTLQSLLFADTLENFRDVMMNNYRLDVMHYFSLPGYSWDSALLMTDVSLELLTDEEMHAAVLNGIRGGTTVVGTPRLARANNDQMPEGCYDPGKPTSYIYYLDYNSLYPSVMADFPLPTFGFRWMSEFEIERFDVMSVPADSNSGYILICDIKYPDDLHDLHDAYPMCPESRLIGEEDVSQYTRDLAASCNMTLRPDRKLCLTLHDKSHYAVHYLTLQCYIRHGLQVTKVHKVVVFSQSFWLQDFVQYTTKKRRESTNDFDNMLYKSVACNVFGK